MAAAPVPTPTEMPAAAEAQAELSRVLASPAFAGATAHQRLLRYVTEHSLAGNTALLKETVLGIEVFMRPAGSFDPRHDSIVRVEARRLRERLRQHYLNAPPLAEAPWAMVLPKGSYRVQWQRRAAQALPTQAAELVERGLFFLRQGHDEGHRKALQRFEEAAVLQPDLAAAHSGVARAWLQLVATNLEPPRPGIDLALAAVHRALALQPLHADSLVLAAQMTHRFAFDWSAARTLFERAARAAQGMPQAAYVQHAHALSLMLRGHLDEAETKLAHARVQDPLSLTVRAHQALLCLYRRQWPAAEAALQALLDMSADNVLGMSLLAYVSLCRGDAATALAIYQRVGQRHPQLSIGAAGQAQALSALGQGAQARRVLADLQQSWAGRYLSPYQLAMAELRMTDHATPEAGFQTALTLLQRAVDERDPNALCLPVDPAFDVLRGQAQFEALVAQVLGIARSAQLRC